MWKTRIVGAVLAGLLALGFSAGYAFAAEQPMDSPIYAECNGSSSSAKRNECMAKVDARIAEQTKYQTCAGKTDQALIDCKAAIDNSKADTAVCSKFTDNPTARLNCEESIRLLVDKYKIPQETAQALTTFIVILSIVLKMLYSLLVPIAGMIGKFMSGDWVSGGVFNVDVLIETLWQIIRNMVNIVIILYLVYVAARNIVPFGDNGQYDVKRVLPKVALALVVVNFSFFFCRTILSFANITTTMAFSMPNTIGANIYNKINVTDGASPTTTPYIWYEPIGPDLAKQKAISDEVTKITSTQKISKDSIFAMECLHKNYAFNFNNTGNTSEPTLIANPKINENRKFVTDQNYYKRILITNATAAGSTESSITAPTQEEYAKQTEEVRKQKAENAAYPYYSDCIHTFEEMSFSARNAMYVYAFNLLRIPSYEKSFTDIQGFADITTRLFISAFFLVMFFGITIAMLVAMVARTFFLWFMMMLSPVWVLTDVLKVWRGDDVDKEGVLGGYGKFIALAFMPTILGVVLSVGFMMVHLITLFATRDGTANGRLNMGSISVWFDPAQPVGGVGDLFSTMMGIFALMALWIAVFAAFKFGFKSIKLASTVLEKFESGAKRVGGFIARTPLDAQVLPFGQNGAKVSASTLLRAPNQMMENIEAQRRENVAQGIRNMGLDPSTKLSDLGRSEIQNGLQSTTNDATKSFDVLQKNAQSYEGRAVRDKIMDNIVRSDGMGLVNANTLSNGIEVESNGRKYKVSGQQALAMHKHFTDMATNDNAKFRDFLTGFRNSADARRNGRYMDGSYLSYHDKFGSFVTPTTAKPKYTVGTNNAINLEGRTTPYMNIGDTRYKNAVIAARATKVVPTQIVTAIDSFIADAKRTGLAPNEIRSALQSSITGHTYTEILNWEYKSNAKKSLQDYINEKSK